MLYNHRLSAEEAQSVDELLKPLFAEIELEMMEKDPLLKQVHETLAGMQNRQQVNV